MRSFLCFALFVSAVATAAEPAKAGTKAAEPAKADANRQLTADEQMTMCSANLVKQLECKDDFCTAMVKMRIEKDPKFKGGDPKELRAMCLTEIVADGG